MRQKYWALPIFSVKLAMRLFVRRIGATVNNSALFADGIANSLTTGITNVGVGSRLKQGWGNRFPGVSRWDLCSRLWFRPATNLPSGAHGVEHTPYDLLGTRPMGDVGRLRFEQFRVRQHNAKLIIQLVEQQTELRISDWSVHSLVAYRTRRQTRPCGPLS